MSLNYFTLDSVFSQFAFVLPCIRLMLCPVLYYLLGWPDQCMVEQFHGQLETMHIALLACTLGIGNVVALSYNYYQSGGQSMFFKMTTDSDKHVKNIEGAVDKLEHNLSQWYLLQRE